MNILKKISDWATNNSINFQHENEVYDAIIKEINTINDLSDIALTSDFALDYSFTFNGGEMNLYTLRDYINMRKNIMFRTPNEIEAQKIQQEIKKLEELYQRYYEQLKDTFLRVKELYDIQEQILNLNRDIYQNPTLEAFKNIEKERELLTKEWRLKEIEDLRSSISSRKMVIIPYLGEIQKKK